MTHTPEPPRLFVGAFIGAAAAVLVILASQLLGLH